MANVLIIGVSGAGKTTFVKTLRQPLYTQAAGIQSDTKVVVSNELLFDIDTEFYTIQVLDTPGFDDNREGQSDLDLEELILNFIKRGVTGLNLILVALPINRRYTATTLNSMVKVLEFLGPDMSQVSAILLTNAESTPDAERQAWYEGMKNIQGTDMLVEYCKLGVVYTGMYTGQEDKATFLERQARDQRQIIQLAMNTAPIEITGDAPDIMNKFKVHESSAKDALTIKRYLPELDESLAKLRRLRYNLPSDPRLKFYSDFCARLDAEKLESKITHWNSLPELTDKFIQETQGINSAAQELRRTFGKVNVLISTTERASSIVKLKLGTGIDLEVLQKWFEEKEEDQAASSSSSTSTTAQ